MNISADSTPAPKFFCGYSSWEPSAIVKFVTGGGDIGAVPGDFVVGDAGHDASYAISSALSAQPWYWAESSAGALVMGANIFDVVERAKLGWSWNSRAIQSIALYGHTIGDDTLHTTVFRLPAATRLSKGAGGVRLESLAFWNELRWDEEEFPNAAFSALEAAFLDCQDGSNPLLSLSSGYDSRLLLSLFLKHGLCPSLAVMGSPMATDVVIASRLAARTGLELKVVQLSAQDYLTHGQHISRLTSGSKTAANWHTWLYGMELSKTNQLHFVGSNGEFARSFFFDKPSAVNFSQRFPGSWAQHYFLARLVNRYRKFSRHNVLVRRGLNSLLNQVGGLHEDAALRKFMPALDVIYARTRVRHFIGAGLACYADYGRPRSPFLDGRWIQQAARLDRQWKLGSAFHREAMNRFHPDILQMPFNVSLDGGNAVSYSLFEKLVSSPEVMDLIIESAALDALTTRSMRLRVLEDKWAASSEAVNFFLTLHFACVNADQCAERSNEQASIR